jgi:hypothetical protein
MLDSLIRLCYLREVRLYFGQWGKIFFGGIKKDCRDNHLNE